MKLIKVLRNYVYQFVYLAFALAISACNTAEKKQVEIRGVYGHPAPLWEKQMKLPELGINAIFVHSGSINQEMMERAKKEDIKVFAEFATLNGKNYVDKHPEAWAIDAQGNKVEQATWFMGVCPTEPGFKKYRKDQLTTLLQNYDLDGVFLDYVHWHAQFEDPNPILPETCFCDHCIDQFSSFLQLPVEGEDTVQKAAWILNNHDEQWRNWRCQVVYDWTVEMKAILKAANPNALLGLYHCPWSDEEYDGARRRILGLDYDLLKESVEVFSPMVYHGRMERAPEWVAENISWFSQAVGIPDKGFPKLWPIVQAYDNPYVISPSEFKTVLEGGLSANSTGVMMFTTRALADNDDKIETMKLLYLNLAQEK